MGRKRKVGRPKVKKAKQVKRHYRKRVKKEELPDTVHQSKFLGYCPKCLGIVGGRDKISKFVVECCSCGKNSRINKLKDKRGDEDLHPRSRKEYLDTVIHTGHENLVPMSEEHIADKDLKIKE